MQFFRLFLPLVLFVGLASGQTIVRPADAPANVQLAAKEIRRYVYLRTGKLLPIAESGNGIALRIDPALGAQEYRVAPNEISGGSDVGVLYGAYRYAELLGVRFYLHGDVIPDGRLKDLPVVKDEVGKPIFETRGIQPFHDFPEGPDWWTTDDYLAYVSQLAKMRMNFVGFHSYHWEPLVWHGVPEDVADDGTVKTSYPSGWFRCTQGAGTWNLKPCKTGDYTAGASELFVADDMRSDVDTGDSQVFDRVGDLLGKIVATAHARGVKVCVGSETPLGIPGPAGKRLQELGRTDGAREIYKGTFKWLMKNAPVDYYWLWTPEGWIWGGNSQGQYQATANDIQAALGALEELGKPFPLGTSGWVIGPQQDRSAWDRLLPKDSPIANISTLVGHAAVDPSFAQIKNRPKWAIPWFENDPDLMSYQPWCKRLRYDAADARRLGCTGLLGIHWRTKALAANIAVLAEAGWDQSWAANCKLEPPSVKCGTAAAFTAPVTGAAPSAIYQSLRYGLDGYPVDVPNGTYTVTLKFNEPHYGASGKRVFGVRVQRVSVMDQLDIFAKVGKNHGFDLVIPRVRVSDGAVNIGFTPVVEYPSLCAVEIVGTADAGTGIGATGAIVQQPSRPYARRINCGGPACGDFEADIVRESTAIAGINRGLPAGDFYGDFARANFGASVAVEAGEIMAAADGFTAPFAKTPEFAGSSCWGIRTLREPWEAIRTHHYLFAEKFAALRPRVTGAGNLERFDYWMNTMNAAAQMMHIACLRGELDATMEKLSGASDATAKKAVANAALSLRLRLAREWENLMRMEIAMVSTPGELGTIAALEQHGTTWRSWLPAHDKALTAALGTPLPADAIPSKNYAGPAKLTPLTVRTAVAKGEALTLKIIAIDSPAVKSVTARVRPLGGKEWRTIPANHVARAVWNVTLPAAMDDFEYDIVAEAANGAPLIWPATAPGINQTVIVQ